MLSKVRNWLDHSRRWWTSNTIASGQRAALDGPCGYESPLCPHCQAEAGIIVTAALLNADSQPLAAPADGGDLCEPEHAAMDIVYNSTNPEHMRVRLECELLRWQDALIAARQSAPARKFYGRSEQVTLSGLVWVIYEGDESEGFNKSPFAYIPNENDARRFVFPGAPDVAAPKIQSRRAHKPKTA
jgi:hypothetical protein